MKLKLFIFSFVIIFFMFTTVAFAQEDATATGFPALSVSVGGGDSPQSTVDSVQALLLLSLISILPYLLFMMTPFTRLIISLHFLRAALGTQQMPPNQILIGLALVLTVFIIRVPLQEINDTAIEPFVAKQINQETAINNAIKPMREFMIKQADLKDIAMFTSIANISEPYGSIENVPTSILIPAYVLGELKWGFFIGFLIYIPFIVIDMVVASTLMAMGMMMLPPAMISLPFKIMVFILANGWEETIMGVVKSFKM